MNQTFSLPRFARLNRWLWATKGRTYLFAAVALLVIVVLILSPALRTGYGYSANTQRSNIIYFGILAMLLAGSVGSDAFSALFRQESAIAYLMIPASRSEKFWLGILYSVLALLLFCVAFFGYEAIVFNIANSNLPASEPIRYVPSLIYYTTISPNIDNALLRAIIYTILLSMAIALLGSLFFRRGVFVRSIAVALMTAVALFYLYRWIIGWQFGEYRVDTSLPFYPTNVDTEGRYENLSLPNWLTFGMYLGTLLALWVISRVRFNEIER
jgi:hypothetical protein